jgi:hypothetical protein
MKNVGSSGQVLNWIREGVSISFLNNRPPPPFDQGISLMDASPEQLTVVYAELARFVKTLEPTVCRRYMSILFLVAKPGTNQWGYIVDLRHLNSLCVRKRLRMESVLKVRHLTRKGDGMFSFDMKDEFYAMKVIPKRRDFLNVNADNAC